MKLQTSATARAAAAGGKSAGEKRPFAKTTKRTTTAKPGAKASKPASRSAGGASAAKKQPVGAKKPVATRASAAATKAGAKTRAVASKAGKNTPIQKAKKTAKAAAPAPEMSARDQERRALALTGAELAIELALDKKAVGPVLIDVSSQASYTDYIGIVSGRSDRQVEAIADHVSTTMKSQGWTLVGREGTSNGRWTLLDFGDLILHIFYHPVRDVYDIEGLWVGAPRVPLKNVPPEAMHFQADALYAQP